MCAVSRNRAFFSQVIALDVAKDHLKTQKRLTANAERRRRNDDAITGYGKACERTGDDAGYWLTNKADRWDDDDSASKSNELLIGASAVERKEFTAMWEREAKAKEEVTALATQAGEVVAKLRSPLLTRWRRPKALVLPQVDEVKALFAEQQSFEQEQDLRRHPTPLARRIAGSPPLSPAERHDMAEDACGPAPGALEVRPALRRMLDVRTHPPEWNQGMEDLFQRHQRGELRAHDLGLAERHVTLTSEEKVGRM